MSFTYHRETNGPKSTSCGLPSLIVALQYPRSDKVGLSTQVTFSLNVSRFSLKTDLLDTQTWILD